MQQKDGDQHHNTWLDMGRVVTYLKPRVQVLRGHVCPFLCLLGLSIFSHYVGQKISEANSTHNTKTRSRHNLPP